MRELTSDLPGNSSRTSTQASNVPVTALTAETAIATRMVNLNAATASGDETAFQKPESPLSVLVATSAASGSSTITLSHATAIPSSGGRLIDATLRKGSDPLRRVASIALLCG